MCLVPCLQYKTCTTFSNMTIFRFILIFDFRFYDFHTKNRQNQLGSAQIFTEKRILCLSITLERMRKTHSTSTNSEFYFKFRFHTHRLNTIFNKVIQVHRFHTIIEYRPLQKWIFFILNMYINITEQIKVKFYGNFSFYFFFAAFLLLEWLSLLKLFVSHFKPSTLLH